MVRWLRRRIHETQTGPPEAGACDAPRDSLHVVLHHPGAIAVQLGVAMLDRLAGEADAQHECGYEEAVLRGSAALVPPVSACCASLGGAKAALDAVDEVRNTLLLLSQCS